MGSKRRVGSVALVLMLVIAVAGCGSRVQMEPLADVAGGRGSDIEPVEMPGPAAAASDDGSAGASDMAVSGTATPVPTALASLQGTFPPNHNTVLKVKLTPRDCVTHGSVLLVTLKGPALGYVSMIIAFADYHSHGAMNVGQADVTGTYVWRVPIEPTIPEGAARLLAGSSGPNGDKEGGGSADATFMVRGLARC